MQTAFVIYNRIVWRSKSLHNIEKLLSSLSKELQNSFIVPQYYFVGEKDKIKFITIANIEEKGLLKKELLEIEYIGIANGVLKKVKQIKNKNKVNTYKFNDLHIKKVEFEFPFYDKTDDKIVWHTSWNGGKFKTTPRAIRIKFKLYLKNNKDEIVLDKTIIKSVYLPNGRIVDESV